MSPEISCPLQYLHVSTVLCPENESVIYLQNLSVPLNGEETSITVYITGLYARENYYADFSILDQAGVVVDTGSTHFFSKSTEYHGFTSLFL